MKKKTENKSLQFGNRKEMSIKAITERAKERKEAIEVLTHGILTSDLEKMYIKKDPRGKYYLSTTPEIEKEKSNQRILPENEVEIRTLEIGSYFRFNLKGGRHKLTAFDDPRAVALDSNQHILTVPQDTVVYPEQR